MKKVLSIVLALALVFGFAGMTFAMGPDGADPTSVGFWLTSFKVSDAVLSPMLTMNWSGTLSPTKTYAEGQPIWFVAYFVNRALVAGDNRNFNSAAGGGPGLIRTRTVTFTSKDNCLNYSFSSAYMNFALIDGIRVIGNSVAPGAGMGTVSATANALEVTFVAANIGLPTAYTSVNAQNLQVIDATADVSTNYYLQIMAFTNSCNEAQGTAYASMGADFTGFGDDQFIDDAGALPAAGFQVTLPAGNVPNVLNLYDANGAQQYSVQKYVIRPGAVGNVVTNVLGYLGNINAALGDSLYRVLDNDGVEIICFVSSGRTYKGMCRWTAAGGNDFLDTVQYTSDQGGNGRYAYSSANNGIVAQQGTVAVDRVDLEALMTFLGFSFANNFPVLDKHFTKFAGMGQRLEALYNVAAAVITNPDPGVDIVPKTGDASTAFGMIMVAIAGLAAVGFVMMKRVRG